LNHRPVALRQDRSFFGSLSDEHGLQPLDIVRQIGFLRHARDRGRDAGERQRSIPSRVNLPLAILKNGPRDGYAAHVNPRPGQPLQKGGKLRGREAHHSILNRRPLELSRLPTA